MISLSSCKDKRIGERKQERQSLRRLGGLAAASLLGSTLALGVNSAHAQAGSLDPSFGTGGKVVTNLGINVIPEDAALDRNGNILVAAGVSDIPVAGLAFGVVRYRSNGRLDTTFGNGGFALAVFSSFENIPSAMALQSDGKIIVVGEARSADGTLSEFGIARFASNGALDSTFGTGGKVTTNFVGVQTGGVGNPATAVLVQPDGKIIVGGVASQCAKCVHFTVLARYNPDGSLDATFGNGGRVSVRAIGTVSALAVLADGDILAVNNGLGALAQFTPQGALEPTVTSGTIVASSHGLSVAFQPDSKIVVLGTAIESPPGIGHDFDVKVFRLNPTGEVDPTFVSLVFDFGPEDFSTNSAEGVAFDSNLKIVVGGESGRVRQTFGLARLNTDGTLDSTFGSGGKVITNFNDADTIRTVVIQPDGKIVAVGSTCLPGGQSCIPALARYLGK